MNLLYMVRGFQAGNYGCSCLFMKCDAVKIDISVPTYEENPLASPSRFLPV